VHMEDREDKASSHELSTTMPYQPFSWDEGNVVVDVYQMMSSSFSSSFLKTEHISKVTPTKKIVLPNGGFQEFTTSYLKE
jgi:hypothetical protein